MTNFYEFWKFTRIFGIFNSEEKIENEKKNAGTVVGLIQPTARRCRLGWLGYLAQRGRTPDVVTAPRAHAVARPVQSHRCTRMVRSTRRESPW
jgi:hypothetical protein